MRALRSLILATLLGLWVGSAVAAEQIDVFDVVIDVERDGDIVVTEQITVTAEGERIRRGIFRDLPRYFEVDGERFAYDYELLDVERNGRDEPHQTALDGSAFRVVVGDEDVFLDNGRHEYTISYRVKNQVRYFDTYDEVYWNATGNYWSFAIVNASAVVNLPGAAAITGVQAYTGPLGATGADYVHQAEGVRHTFTTTRPLAAGEGLTIALGFEKGLIEPPSGADRGALLWQRYGALAILFASTLGLFAFLLRSWRRVGVDPARLPVFPRYEPPKGYSPAAVHHIYHRGLAGHRALIATLLNLAVRGRVSVDADHAATVLERASAADAGPADAFSAEDLDLERAVFSQGDRKVLGERYDAAFTAAYAAFRTALSKRYGENYFKWNLGYTLGAVAASGGVFVLAASQTINWTHWHTFGVLALAALNAVFFFLMPAPTRKGAAIWSEIAGLRLYMNTAEKLQLNAVDPVADVPPPMTAERYERFLPYAIALDVEEPWTKHFERVLPQEAEAYQPKWSHSGLAGSRALGAVSSALVANMSTGVSAAMPQSSSSSGSGGGGSSGGGGGGGGGGGW